VTSKPSYGQGLLTYGISSYGEYLHPEFFLKDEFQVKGERDMTVKRILQASIFFSVLLVLSVAISSDRDYWPTKNWKPSPPEKQGMEPEILGQISSYVKETCPNPGSVLIVRHGYIVFEEYFSGGEDDLIQLYCVAKSVTSALIGIALKEGYLKNIDQKMIDFFPEFVSDDLNPQVNNITIRHLLTMSAGFGRSDMGIMTPDLIKDMLNHPLETEPGQEFSYNTTSSNILSMIITKATGMKALDFGNKYLFKPLGISTIRWEDASGYTYGGLGIQLTPRDMAKIGYLYLNNGRWGKKQILRHEWVAESTRLQIDVPKSQKAANADYACHWWVRSTGGYHSYFAWGAGGKFIYVIPDLDIVAVTTTYETVSDLKYLSIIDNYVVPSVLH